MKVIKRVILMRKLLNCSWLTAIKAVWDIDHQRIFFVDEEEEEKE